ncbi:DsbE family thiol:disulfide interchange protein [Parathalassolituus penaei]|uniref:DsbE family thiol:disulfide interchange protein n=1 Tax=Parathalassolituus penaei TaxID=2997323 RepID=A0A9X3EA39_9GAMM|nr:DsbE family thiol:disulfide interchange protein [Parathalassolituus penaei]MCY0963749.1 DsbE family thiol:disulfide interchange protein [Parathalassolituus penaei]
MKRLFLFLPLLACVILGVVFFLSIGREDKDVLPSPLIGQPFPTFNTDALESGAPLGREHLLGKPALVNVWATWCPTCKAEHEFLNILAEEGVTIYGINYKDDDEKARQWLFNYGNPYDLVLRDPDGKLGLDLGVYGAPETFLIDSQGIIRGKHVGDLNARVWEKLEAEYRALK